MIELARRFVINSPILFRMSTRMRVLDANDIRYGVDSEQGFRTFTTSKGIKQIIMMSASYFNSLDPSAPGMDDQTQRGMHRKKGSGRQESVQISVYGFDSRSRLECVTLLYGYFEDAGFSSSHQTESKI